MTVLNALNSYYEDIAPLLDISLAIYKPLLILGEPGIGKSQMIAEYAKKKGLVLSDIRLGSKDVTDFVIPSVNSDLQKVVQCITDEIPLDGKVPTLVMFDELTNSDPRLTTVIYGIILERRIANKRIPDNVYFVAAGNRQDDNCFVNEMPAALVSRFTVVNLMPSVERWIKTYAVPRKINPMIVSFLSVHPEYFTATSLSIPNAADLMIRPSARSWTAISDAMAIMDTTMKTLTTEQYARILSLNVGGIVGKEIAVQFMHHIEQVQSSLDFMKIFSASSKELPALLKGVKTMAQLYSLAYSGIAACSTKENLFRYGEMFLVLSKNPKAQINEIWTTATGLLLSKFQEIMSEDEGIEALLEYYSQPAFIEYKEKNEAFYNILKSSN